MTQQFQALAALTEDQYPSLQSYSHLGTSTHKGRTALDDCPDGERT